MALMRKFPPPTAVRRYGVEGEPGREIVLKIGQPFQSSPPGGEWSCPVLIEGVGDEQVKYICGVDGIQAIQQAMAYARHELDASGLSVTWLDQEPGDVGLPLSIQSTFGLWFQRRLESLVEEEERRIGEIQGELLKARTRRRGRA
jgi:hypothetical protein